MNTEKFKTQAADYQVHINTVDSKRPYSIFFHGGPGLNSYAERQIIGPSLNAKLNFLWFDLLGCAESPARSDEMITWDRQIDDVAQIVKEFGGGSVNVISHCFGAHVAHDFVRNHRSLVRSVLFLAPVNRVSTIFKSIVARGILERRLVLKDFSETELREIAMFFSTPEELFTSREAQQALGLAARIRDYQELYWSDPKAMQTYFQHMAEKPMSVNAFLRLQGEFFDRGERPLPSYEGIPVSMIYSNNDMIAPWEFHGKQLLQQIPHAKVFQVDEGSHWVHLQKPGECTQRMLELLS